MIVDFRRYTLKPGQLAPYLQLYGRSGYAAQARHLGPALGWFVTDVGPQNQVVHLWQYPSMAEMEARRRALADDPDWREARAGMTGLFEEQRTEILSVVPDLPYARGAAAPGLADIRIYTLHHGRMAAFLSFLRERSGAVQARHWPDNIAYLTSNSGTLNRVVHIWGHADHAQRLERRKALLADPDWQDCLKTILPMIKRMETVTATPVPFWTRRKPEE